MSPASSSARAPAGADRRHMTCRFSFRSDASAHFAGTILVLAGILGPAAGMASAQPPGPGAAAAAALNPNAVVPGEFVIEPATLINLGFEWFIQGDDNRNAAVAVSYRKKGDAPWKNA